MEIDTLRGIAIFLVFLGHTGFLKTQYTWPLYTYITSFHMPLFFFISGYLRRGNYQFEIVVKKKIKRLILPYIFIAVASFLYWHIAVDSINAFNETLKELSNKEMIIGYLYSQYHYMPYFNAAIWFLLCLFITEIMYELIINYCKKFKYWVMILFILTGFYFYKIFSIHLPWNMDAAFVGLAFYHIGYSFAKNKEVISNFSRKIGVIILLGLLHVFFVLLNSLEIGSVNIAIPKFGNIIYFFSAAFSGIILCYLLSKYLVNNLLILLGQYSLTILATHEIYYGYFPNLITTVLFNTDVHNTLFRGKLIQFLSLILLSLITFVLIKFYSERQIVLTSKR